MFAFILSVAFVYYPVATRLPSRLIANQAPRSRFELVPVDGYNIPARAGGVEYVARQVKNFDVANK